MDSISSFFVSWHMQLYALIHHIILRLYLYFLNILTFSTTPVMTSSMDVVSIHSIWSQHKKKLLLSFRQNYFVRKYIPHNAHRTSLKLNSDKLTRMNRHHYLDMFHNNVMITWWLQYSISIMEMNYVIYSTADIRWGTQDNYPVDVAMFNIFPPKSFSLIHRIMCESDLRCVFNDLGDTTSRNPKYWNWWKLGKWIFKGGMKYYYCVCLAPSGKMCAPTLLTSLN